MMVPEPDLAPDLDAGPCAGPKIYGILKFNELQVFSVFNDMNGISNNFCWFSGENGKFDDGSTCSSSYCSVSDSLWCQFHPLGTGCDS